jgi:hypothetical protein
VLRVPILDGDARRTHGGFILVRAKEGPTSSGEGRVLYFLAPRCLRRGYKLVREGTEPKSQGEKKEYMGDCLRC